MPKKADSTLILIALCTSAALLAFAFDQRHKPLITVSTGAFYLAAALICILPALYAGVRRKTCRTKTRT